MRHLRWLVPSEYRGWRQWLWFATHGDQWGHEITQQYAASHPLQHWANEQRTLSQWSDLV